MQYLFILMVILAGVSLPVQAMLNARLGKVLGDPIYASLISFTMGALSLFLYALATKVNLGTIKQAAQAHWVVWFAGMLGAFSVTVVIVMTPKLGTTLTFALVIAGQLGIAVILDHYGWMGLSVHSFNWMRMLGLLLICTGVLLIHRF